MIKQFGLPHNLRWGLFTQACGLVAKWGVMGMRIETANYVVIHSYTQTLFFLAKNQRDREKWQPWRLWSRECVIIWLALRRKILKESKSCTFYADIAYTFVVGQHQKKFSVYCMGRSTNSIAWKLAKLVANFLQVSHIWEDW